MIGEHNDALLLDLLEQRLKLNDDGLSLSRFDRSHSIQDREATEWTQGLQTESFLKNTDILNKDLLSLFESNWDFAKFKDICVWHQSFGNSCCSNLQEECLDGVTLAGIHISKVDWQEPIVVLGAGMGLLNLKIGYFTAH